MRVRRQVHPGGVGALYAYPPLEAEGPCLATGGADGVVKLCGADLEAKVTINLRDPRYGPQAPRPPPLPSACLRPPPPPLLL